MSIEARVARLEEKSPAATQYWASCIVDIGQDKDAVVATVECRQDDGDATELNIQTPAAGKTDKGSLGRALSR
jgi:hypothetical protein